MSTKSKGPITSVIAPKKTQEELLEEYTANGYSPELAQEMKDAGLPDVSSANYQPINTSAPVNTGNYPSRNDSYIQDQEQVIADQESYIKSYLEKQQAALDQDMAEAKALRDKEIAEKEAAKPKGFFQTLVHTLADPGNQASMNSIAASIAGNDETASSEAQRGVVIRSQIEQARKEEEDATRKRDIADGLRWDKARDSMINTELEGNTSLSNMRKQINKEAYDERKAANSKDRYKAFSNGAVYDTLENKWVERAPVKAAQTKPQITETDKKASLDFQEKSMNARKMVAKTAQLEKDIDDLVEKEKDSTLYKFTGGGLGGESLSYINKQLFGDADEVKELRTRIQNVINVEVINSLPSGAASDADIILAQQGFPDQNLTVDEYKQFVRGVNKLAKYNEIYYSALDLFTNKYGLMGKDENGLTRVEYAAQVLSSSGASSVDGTGGVGGTPKPKYNYTVNQPK